MLKRYLTTTFPTVDLTIKSNFSYSLKIKIVAVIKTRRMIVWFNPPYNCDLATNIGKTFLWLLDKHFPKSSELSKVFSQNNVKMSYRSMPNIASITSFHNRKILNENVAKPTSASLNCRVLAFFPLDGNCLQSSLVYICKAVTPNIIKDYPNYIGLAENTFKDRLCKHKS